MEDLISNLDSSTHETELLCLSSREPGVVHQELVWQLRRVEQLLVRGEGGKLGWSQASNLAVESDGRHDLRVVFRAMIVFLMMALKFNGVQI